MRTTVAVLRGGPGGEYEVSLKSGATVLAELDQQKYEPRDIFIDRAGQWHLHGVAVTPEAALRGADVAFNVVHGAYGEDGTLQKTLQTLGVPYTGADALASALSFNKHQSRELAKNLGVKVAHGVLIEPAADIEAQAFELFRTFPHPAMVKPVAGGSSVGMSKVDNFHALAGALERAFAVAPQVLVEEFIPGKEATVGVIDNFRNEKSYALMPIEIIPPKEHGFFSYDAKYSGQTAERVPGNFTPEEKTELARLAKLAHEGLGLTHYSRSDFIVSKRGIYFLEINSAAAIGMTKESLFPKALNAVGAKLSDFFSHVVDLALRRQ